MNRMTWTAWLASHHLLPPWFSILPIIFFLNQTPTTEIYTLSLHDALPIYHRHVRPAFLECTACSKRYEVRLINTCDCGGQLFARYEWTDLGTDQLTPRKVLWSYATLLPLMDSEIGL